MECEVIERDSQAMELTLVIRRPRTIDVEHDAVHIPLLKSFPTNLTFSVRSRGKCRPKPADIQSHKRGIYNEAAQAQEKRKAHVHREHVRRYHMRVKNTRKLQNV